MSSGMPRLAACATRRPSACRRAPRRLRPRGLRQGFGERSASAFSSSLWPPIISLFVSLRAMKKTLFATALLSIVGFVLAQTPAAPSAASGSDPAFSRFVDDYFDARFAARPTEGTAAGLHQYDGKMPDLSRAGDRERIAELKAAARRACTALRPGEALLRRRDRRRGARGADPIGSCSTWRRCATWENNPMQYAGAAGLRRRRPDEARLRAGRRPAALGHRRGSGPSRRSARRARPT